jgi:hypothetical protein
LNLWRPLRLARVLAVARRDLRQRSSGRRWWRLPILAVLLLVPTAAVPISLSGSTFFDMERRLARAEFDRAVVAGQVPEELAGRIETAPVAYIYMYGSDPVRLKGRRIPAPLREVLDELPGADRVQRREVTPPFKLPDRSFLVAVLAVSLLMGPLAESLPGERARKTLEVLLAAGVSRGELVAGKWLAWTSAACSTAMVASVAAILTGVQAPGDWLVGLVLFIACGVALGLWLVRAVGDLVGGAAAPMRVIPAVSVTLALAAAALGRLDPVLGAMVPIGGALLAAGDRLDSSAELLAASASTMVTVGAFLTLTARDLDRSAAGRMRRVSAGGVLVASGAAWWTAVVVPSLWSAAGNPDVALPFDEALVVAGALLVAVAVVATIREGRSPVDLVRTDLVGLGLGALGGVALAFADALDTAPAVAQVLADPAMRLRDALAPAHAGIAAAAASALGLVAVWRGVLDRRIGAVTSVAAWTLVITPADPLLGLISGSVLTALTRARGAGAALVAHGVWYAAVQLAG